MNRLFEGAFRDADGRQPPTASAPRIDVYESVDEIVLAADLPGMTQEEVELTVEGDMLTFAGERKAAGADDGRTWHIAERTYGRFERSLKLPFVPDPGKVTADFQNGVLNVRVPKAALQDRGRRIAIGAGAARSSSGDERSDNASQDESRRVIDKAARQAQNASA